MKLFLLELLFCLGRRVRCVVLGFGEGRRGSAPAVLQHANCRKLSCCFGIGGGGSFKWIRAWEIKYLQKKPQTQKKTPTQESEKDLILQNAGSLLYSLLNFQGTEILFSLGFVLQTKALMKSRSGLLKCHSSLEGEVMTFPGARFRKVSGGNGENPET